ncbi:MAG: sulfatase family protein [Armatimonadota bacterium]
MPTPNILLFISDGHRADALGCYGNTFAETTHLDAFAEEAVRFDHAYCVHSVCMPTRASITTGRYPHAHGVWANGISLPRTEITLPQVLASHGYATAACGKVHLEPQQPYGDAAPIITDLPYYGFDEVHLSENTLGQEYLDFVAREHPDLMDRALRRDLVPEEAHDLTWITDQALDFISRQSVSETPFFCACSFHELSPPCTPPPGYAGYFDPTEMVPPQLRPEDLDGKPAFYRQCYEGYLRNGRQPDEPTLREHIASYYDQQRFTDHQFGRLVAALKAQGQWDNTIVIFTADHGLSLNDHWQWRHGPFLFDEVSHIPLLWRVPGMADGGQVRDQFTEQVDLMPTLLDLCGLPSPGGVQGDSLTPILRNSQAVGKDCVLLQERHAPDLEARGLDPNSVNQIAIRTKEFKLIHYVGDTCGELYDLVNDPGEFVNLWEDPAYLPQRRELQSRLLDRLAETQDPLPERHYEW